ncbi:MAG: protein kinase [Cyanobacteria bacterium J06639_1]
MTHDLSADRLRDSGIECPNIPGIEAIALLSEGIYSNFFRAVRSEDRRPVFLEVLKQRKPNPKQIERFLYECEIVDKVDDPIAQRILDRSTYEDYHYVILDGSDGQTLEQIFSTRDERQNRNISNLSSKLRLAIKIVDIIESIHQADIIHKNLNPSTILWDRRKDTVSIMGFEIATELKTTLPW